MSEQTPVLLMNVEGTLYPVGMTEDQVSMLRLFVAGLSQDKPFSVLIKAPVIEAHEIADKVQREYAIKTVK